MPKSVISTNWDFTDEVWIISIINTGDKTGGHAVLLVEGVEKKKESELFSKLFIGQYDIRATSFEGQEGSFNVNKKGKITDIKIFKGDKYTRDYSNYSGKSYDVDPVKAREMIKAIKNDKEITERAKRGEGEYLDYQYLGKNHPLVKLFGDTNYQGDNCAGWCIAKLAIAGIGDGSAKPKPGPASGQCSLL